MPPVLAAHTYSFRDLPLEQALDRLLELGFGHVELWAGHAGDDPEPAGRALESRGLVVVAVGGGGFYEPEDDPGPLVTLAERVGAPVLVACVAPLQLSRVARAAGNRVVLCVENHWDQPLASGPAVRSALDAEPTVRACLDTGHALLAGSRPEAFARQLGPLLRHVHLKEARLPTRTERLLRRRLRRRLLPRPQPSFPGSGALHVGALRGELERLAFAGAVTLEHEGPGSEAALAELLRRWHSPPERASS